MDIPASLVDEINRKVISGEYDSVEHVLRRALDVLNVHDQTEAEIRENIVVGREQLNRGEGIPAVQVFEDLRRRNKAVDKETTK